MIDTLIDTNILVYAHSDQDERKRAVAVARLSELYDNKSACLTTQILAEFYVSMRRLLKPILGNDRQAQRTARELLSDYAGLFPVLHISEEDVVAAASLVESHSLSFWDALVWSSAKSHGVKKILSEDGPTGTTIEDVTFVNPFLEQ